MSSHLQTRTLIDALSEVDVLLQGRGTALQASPQRAALARSFAAKRHPKFFDAWAFSAAEYELAVWRVREVAPALAAKLEPPTSPGDFTIVGNCALDLRFKADPNGANKAHVKLRDGTRAFGAEVKASGALVYAKRLVALPATSEGQPVHVYFYQPNEDPADTTAAELAAKVFTTLGSPLSAGVTLRFPVARTSSLPDCGWVSRLQSACRLYAVGNHVSAGEALVDHNGFFARETQVVQVAYLSISRPMKTVVINGPFLVFFADEEGVHAAAWFDWDAFSLMQ